MAYLETDLKTELRAALRAAGCVAEKFPDHARGVIKPYDLVASIGGRYAAIETKLAKVGTERALARRAPGMIVVRLADVRPNQARALDDVWERGGWPFLGAALYERSTHARECWMVPWPLFREREVWTLSALQQLQELGAPHLAWRWGHGWDAAPLLAWSTRHYDALRMRQRAFREEGDPLED